jgi:hypothetical protein
MYDLGNCEDGEHHGKQHRPFHGRRAIELALPFHALRM